MTVAVMGCGHWGRNLVRNFAELGALAAIHDPDVATARAMSVAHAVPSRSWKEIIDDPSIHGVVLAAPAARHADLAIDALSNGKHVFVEKPLSLTVPQGEEVVAAAAVAGRVLMVGHLLQYHAAFLALRRILDEGRLGRLQYLYSNRLNLGKIRREENALWSFAPHDISMILALVRDEPSSVSAVGARFLHRSIADVTTTHLSFPGGEQAHVFVSWLHPFKEQKLVVVGDRGMAVFDDGEPWDRKLVVYAHRVDWEAGMPLPVKAEAEPVPIEPAEPLAEECRHFLECMATGDTPRTDGLEGLRVLRVLADAQASMEVSPAADRIPGVDAERGRVPNGVTVHESAFVDEGVDIGAGTSIWHFCHVLTGSRIGRDCSLGQNVVVGPDVTIGDRCRIQNNVSIYSGVTLDDGVFCGPSCVFTNVLTPRAEISRRDEFVPTHVGAGVTIGANATIVCGNALGPWSFIAAGAVVTADVPAHALMVGVPARRIGWVAHSGERLGPDLVCPRTGRRYREDGPDRLVEVSDG